MQESSPFDDISLPLKVLTINKIDDQQPKIQLPIDRTRLSHEHVTSKKIEFRLIST